MTKAKTKAKTSKQTKKLTQVLQQLDKAVKPAASANLLATCSRTIYCV